MNAQLQNLLIGFTLGGLTGWLAWRAGALDRSGAWAASISGGLIFGLGGWNWAVLLLTFFISSSVLSGAFARRKTNLSEKFSKGSRRDLGQVLANGGLAASLALIHAFRPDWDWPWWAFTGALAAVTADTWATELGVLSKTPPRLITTGKQVERGASGGITPLGSLAALAGAALIACVSVLISWKLHDAGWLAFFAVILGGLAGSFFDSFLGATIQAIYTCPACQKETERHPLHTCGTATAWKRGLNWMDNDWVNFFCSLIGAFIAVVALSFIR